MKRIPYLRTAVSHVLCVAALAAVGCGAASVKPHGKVLMNGEPYMPGADEVLQITFVGEGASSVYTAARVNPDGTFTVPGPTNTGIPAGKYHITVTTTAGGGPAGSSPAGGSSPGVGGDKFQGKFADATKTPLTVEIPASGSPPIVVDLGKGTVTTGG